MEVNQAPQLENNPHSVREAFFNLAKNRWLTAVWLKLCVFGISVAGILAPTVAKSTFYAAVFVLMLSELLQLQSDSYRSTAEALLRKLDFQDSFGWPISGREFSEYLRKLPAQVRKRLAEQSPSVSYFESKQGAGPERALENTRESAWWSAQLAQRLSAYCAAGSSVLVVCTLSLLIFTVEAIKGPVLQSNLSRVTTSFFMLLFSAGVLKLTIGHSTFSRKAGETVREAEYELRKAGRDEHKAVSLLYEYQLARAVAPFVPTFFYNRNQPDLQLLWERYCAHDLTQGELKVASEGAQSQL